MAVPASAAAGIVDGLGQGEGRGRELIGLEALAAHPVVATRSSSEVMVVVSTVSDAVGHGRGRAVGRRPSIVPVTWSVRPIASTLGRQAGELLADPIAGLAARGDGPRAGDVAVEAGRRGVAGGRRRTRIACRDPPMRRRPRTARWTAGRAGASCRRAGPGRRRRSRRYRSRRARRGRRRENGIGSWWSPLGQDRSIPYPRSVARFPEKRLRAACRTRSRSDRPWPRGDPRSSPHVRPVRCGHDHGTRLPPLDHGRSTDRGPRRGLDHLGRGRAGPTSTPRVARSSSTWATGAARSRRAMAEQAGAGRLRPRQRLHHEPLERYAATVGRHLPMDDPVIYPV